MPVLAYRQWELMRTRVHLVAVAQHLELHARVIDYWQRGHTVTGALAPFLRRLGFVVETEPVKCWQRGVSCVIVAADTVTSMRLAEQRQTGGWLEADTTGATDINVITDANCCQEEWARPEDCFSAHRLRRDALPHDRRGPPVGWIELEPRQSAASRRGARASMRTLRQSGPQVV